MTSSGTRAYSCMARGTRTRRGGVALGLFDTARFLSGRAWDILCVPANNLVYSSEMDTTWEILSTLLGLGLVALTLVDVFFTVLSPGSGHGPIRRPLARWLRSTFHLARHLPPERRRRVLASLGPCEVILTLVSWFALLLIGWAAIYRPALGAGVTAAQGATDTSWGTALYFSGYDLTTLGLGDLVATTPAYRALVVLEAATGFMTFTLAISYF